MWSGPWCVVGSCARRNISPSCSVLRDCLFKLSTWNSRAKLCNAVPRVVKPSCVVSCAAVWF